MNTNTPAQQKTVDEGAATRAAEKLAKWEYLKDHGRPDLAAAYLLDHQADIFAARAARKAGGK